MTLEADKAMKRLRKIRTRFDALLKDYKGKRPTTYAKLRNFADSLMVIVNEETTMGGFGPTIIPSLATHTPLAVKEKGKVELRESKEEEKKAKELAEQAELDREHAEEELAQVG